MQKPIRVLIVDDSLVCRELLADFIGRSKDIVVEGKAQNGKEALAMNKALRPDLITMDVQMPGMDGFVTIEEIMATQPVPILVVTSSPVRNGVDRTFQALAAGALDLVKKPEQEGTEVEALREKIRVLSGVRVIRRLRPPAGATFSRSPTTTETSPAQRSVVGVVCSTGGPKMLLEMLGALPRNFPSCILITQHIPDGFSASFAQWLNREVAIEVSEARENDPIRPGRVLVAPSDRHLILRTPKTVGLSDDPPVHSLRPSGTVMLRSMARVCGPSSVGMVLTGMGQDGALGLLELRRAGGICLAQDQETSVVFGMPSAAIEMGAAAQVLSLSGLTKFLLSICESRA
jgi:two-component system, chemotaxis family, protein-glutamate methylesterase/glutaminase